MRVGGFVGGLGHLILCPMIMLAGCTTTRLTEPGQTATEQLLVATAIDHSVQQLNLPLRAGTTVYLDPEYLDVAPGDAALAVKYLVASVRDLLLRKGAHLAGDRKTAEMVVELRAAAHSIDHDDFLIGIPAIPVPIPTTTTVVTTPKLALFEHDHQVGIAKLALTAYGRDGSLIASSEPAFGQSRDDGYTLLLLFSWTRKDILPPEKKSD
jgi:hypothetical protein